MTSGNVGLGGELVFVPRFCCGGERVEVLDLAGERVDSICPECLVSVNERLARATTPRPPKRARRRAGLLRW